MSGRMRCRGTPLRASTAKTRSAGTRRHWPTACGEIPRALPIALAPPAFSIASEVSGSERTELSVMSKRKHIFKRKTRHSFMDGIRVFKQSFKMDQEQLDRLGAALRTARKAKKLGLKDVAKAAGVTAQAVGQWERAENGPAMAKLLAVGKLLEIDVNAIVAGVDIRSPAVSRIIRPAGPEVSEVTKVGEGWPDVGDEWMDVRGVTVGGDDSFFYFGDVIDQVRRPPGIRNAKNVAALNVAGESMWPRFKTGELIYVQQRLASPGDDVVVELFPEHEGDPPKAFLKELVRRTGLRIYCKQHNPPIDIEFDAGEAKTVWRVLTMRELLF